MIGSTIFMLVESSSRSFASCVAPSRFASVEYAFSTEVPCGRPRAVEPLAHLLAAAELADEGRVEPRLVDAQRRVREQPVAVEALDVVALVGRAVAPDLDAVLAHRAHEQRPGDGAAERRRVEVAAAGGLDVEGAALERGEALRARARRGSRRAPRPRRRTAAPAPGTAPMSGSSYWPRSAVKAYGIAPFSRIHASAQQVSRPPEKAMPTRSPTGSEPRILPPAPLLTSVSPSRWWREVVGELGARSSPRGPRRRSCCRRRPCRRPPAGSPRRSRRRARPRSRAACGSRAASRSGSSPPAQLRSAEASCSSRRRSAAPGSA